MMEAGPVRVTSVESNTPHEAKSAGNGAGWLVVCLPAAASVCALAHEALLPNADATLAVRLYPLLLYALFGVGVVFAAVSWSVPRFRPTARHVAPLFAAFILTLAAWDVVTTKFAWLPMPYFPGPELVLRGFVDDWTMLAESAAQSLLRLLLGYALGVIAGLTSGVLMGWFRQVRYWGMPVMKLVGPINAIAFVPLVMYLFENPLFSGAALIALAVWFPVTMLTMSGIANVPASYFDVARTLGAGRRYLVFRVALPAAMPSVFVGLFMGMSAAFLTLIVAETVGVRAGLGWYFKWQSDYLEYGKVYAALLIMAVIFSTLMTLLFKVRDWVLGWQRGVIRW
jgi:NitT/TauT family transport system permease protein